MVAQNFLLAVNITFRALQVYSAVLSKQYDNVLNLLQLQDHCSVESDESLNISTSMTCSENSVSAGQFKITSSCMQQLLHRIYVEAVEIADHLDPL